MVAAYGVEAGHHPNRSYDDQNGNYHLNGGMMDLSDGPMLIGPVPSIAAAGTTQGNAAAVPANAAVVLVTGASGTNGVILPTPLAVGQECNLVNTNLTNALKVYPDAGGTGGTINGAAANAAASLPAAKGAAYTCTALGPTAWWSISN